MNAKTMSWLVVLAFTFSTLGYGQDKPVVVEGGIKEAGIKEAGIKEGGIREGAIKEGLAIAIPTADTPPHRVVDLGVLQGNINNSLIYRSFLEGGRSLIHRDDLLNPKQIAEFLKSKLQPSQFPIPPTASMGKLDFQSLAKSSLLFGTVYDCGRCNNLHGNIAGGVVVSSDGLALTNHHVLDRDEEGTLAVFAMTVDGQTHPVVEVLSCDEVHDVALVRLGGPGPFFPAPIAHSRPLPLEPVTVLSHPLNQFFVITQGVVSRHVTLTTKKGTENWTEITADYGAGSSGSGIFNSRGEVIGLVSRNFPIIRNANSKPIAKDDKTSSSKSKPSFVELVLRRCVTLEAIKACFATQ